MRRSVQSMSSPSRSGSVFERSTRFGWSRFSRPVALIVVSSGPKRRLNAICVASVSRCSWKTSTEYSWNASKIWRNVAASSGSPRSTPSTRAPKQGWIGAIVTRLAVCAMALCPLGGGYARLHARGKGPARGRDRWLRPVPASSICGTPTGSGVHEPRGEGGTYGSRIASRVADSRGGRRRHGRHGGTGRGPDATVAGRVRTRGQGRASVRPVVHVERAVADPRPESPVRVSPQPDATDDPRDLWSGVREPLVVGFGDHLL